MSLTLSDIILIIQTGIFIISAIVAYMSFKQSETLNKKNVTISQITYQKQDERYIEAYYTFRDLVNDNFLFEKLIDIKKYKKERRAVSYVLNYYEFISLCVRSKSFDEKIFKELQG